MSTTIHTTLEELLTTLSSFLDHHTSRFELLGGSPDNFIDYPASVMVWSYNVLWTGWHTTSLHISVELHAAINLEKGSLKVLREQLTKQTRAHKLHVLNALLAA